MTVTATLDELHAKGLAAAQEHFYGLVECMHSVLPNGVNGTIPKTLADVAGLFSASTKECSLVILHNTPGYQSMNAVFEYNAESGWSLKKFSVMIGDSNSLFQIPKEYTASCIEDALVLSKQIFKYREKYAAENPAIPSFPDLDNAKPN